MGQDIESLLRAWESFYVIVGPSAAVLIGLQFVVIVLSAEMNSLDSSGAARAFGTPTIVHFCVAFLVSTFLSAPWPALPGLRIALALCGGAGLLYALMVVRDVRRQTSYEPVLEDWIWHCILPVLAYAILLGAAIILQLSPVDSLFVVGATMLLLLFIGIHNAWDAVVYIAAQRRTEQ